MSSGIIGAILGFAGAIFGGLGASTIKEYLDRRRSRAREYQTRWLPLLTAAGHLKQRLENTESNYINVSNEYRWKEYIWTDSNGNNRSLPLLSKDFHELYLIDADPPLIVNFANIEDAPASHRKNQQAVQRVRERIHELNSATISLYRMAVYLGHAQRVLQELQLGQLHIPDAQRRQLIQLILKVRTELNGPSGAGIIDDLQDLIGMSVWTEDDSVISYHKFRERILSEEGWEQFTDLFRFFVHFHFKIYTEVKNTKNALGDLSNTLEKVVEARQRRRFGAWQRRRS